jgi:hypothetical protein
MIQEPYIEETEVIVHRRYNPNYGNDRICNCGHVYYRHFDSYDNMDAVGCKYCPCGDFVEVTGEYSVVDKFVKENAPDRYKELLEFKANYIAQHNATEEEAHAAFNCDLLEEHYRMTQKILNPIMGIMPWKEGDPHPQDILEE